jgi:hypothetical protein
VDQQPDITLVEESVFGDVMSLAAMKHTCVLMGLIILPVFKKIRIFMEVRNIEFHENPPNTGTLRDRAGIDYIEKDKIIRRWKEYTEDLYKKDPNTSIDFQEKAYTQKPLVMKSKVRKALRETTGNKATGIDELPIELIKAAGEAVITALTALCQQIWKSNVWPQE